MKLGVIFDGYIDEPTALGVPPYISPYVRYVAGALLDSGWECKYVTVDQWRKEEWVDELLQRADLVVIVAGLTVPGVYKGGTPLTLSELKRLVESYGHKSLVGGAIRFGYCLKGGRVALAPDGLEKSKVPLVTGDIELAAWQVANGKEIDNRLRKYDEIREWAVLGAQIVKQHPRYPFIICEIETARGCERKSHCSFCTEPMYGKPQFRKIEDVCDEVEALYRQGVRAFRIGKQPNILVYQGRMTESGFMPQPDAVRELFAGIRTVAPELWTLHIDNVNPYTFRLFPTEAELALQVIVDYDTEGDVAAMGIESADPVVVEKNNLKVTPDDALFAVEVVNRVGGLRVDRGLPKLLPGLNFLYGLCGETAATYQKNWEFLEEIERRNLLVRRINVRQVMIFPDTPLAKAVQQGKCRGKAKKKQLHPWKRKVREYERRMLEKVAPIGTVLKRVVTEYHEGNVTFARQLASYPILVGIPQKLSLFQMLDVVVTEHGYRSVTGVPYPLDINSAGVQLLCQLPGIGEARARRIIENRPIKSVEQLARILDDTQVAYRLKEFIRF